jgi:hypothetical protein
MTFAYYYTPCFTGQTTDPDSGDPVGPPFKVPGADFGEGTVEVAHTPAGMVPLIYDDPNTRCVVRVPATTNALMGWVSKTSGEVLADYPGLNGVI